MEKYRKRTSKGSPQRISSVRVTLGLTMVCVVLGACDPVGPGLLRFGSDGLVRVTVEVPLQGGTGSMRQVLTWQSDGAWKLHEEIGYGQMSGDRSLLRSPGLPYMFAANYVSLLHLVNENRGTKLWSLSGEVPECGIGRSRVRFLIRDNMRDEHKEWARCAPKATPLRRLSTQGVDPDDGAARVIQVAMRARDFTLSADFDGYAYTGSLPFGTLERGTESGMNLSESTLFRSAGEGKQGEPPEEWAGFWEEHTDGGRRQPDIDWEKEMVVVGAVGVRREAGDSVEIRRVLVIGNERDVKFEVVERVPGDYCAPARSIVRPFHIAITPRETGQVSFGVRVERVPCGV